MNLNTSPATLSKPLFSVCIPAYNRARHLPRLLDSIFIQSFTDFSIVICEDCSPEREAIAKIVRNYAHAHPGVIFYYENPSNLGYDGNIRNLIQKATGEFCFFMGNDDVMCPEALTTVADILARHPDVGFVLKSYAFFDQFPTQINQEIRYFSSERRFAAGREAIVACYRRSGVIAGYIVRREPARRAATERYDGTLFYQMHLTAQVLALWDAVFTPKVLILCGGDEPPDFGNSACEKGKYVPGGNTPESRLNRVRGALTIIRDFDSVSGIAVADDVERDYANYFYVYIKDQLTLSPLRFFALYQAYGHMGFFKYPMFHLYCALAYILGEKNFDTLTRVIRRRLGRSPHFGPIH